MKNYFYLFAFLVCLATNAFADPVAKPAEWTKFYEHKEYGFERYYDKSSVKPDSRKNIQIRVLSNYVGSPSCSNLGYKDPMTGMGDFCHRSDIWVTKIDCANMTYSDSPRVMYQDLMGKGRSIADKGADTPWKKISNQFPENVELASRVCK